MQLEKNRRGRELRVVLSGELDHHNAAIIREEVDRELDGSVKLLTLGRTDCGGIKAGNRADVIALNFDKPHLLPAFDPLAMLCYSAQGSDVCMTMVDGRILYENGEFLTMDKDRIYHDVKKALKHLYD